MFEHAERTGCMFAFLHDCQLYLANRFATVKRDTLCVILDVCESEQSRAEQTLTRFTKSVSSHIEITATNATNIEEIGFFG